MLKAKYLLCIFPLMILVGTVGCLQAPVSEPTVTQQNTADNPSDEFDGSQWKAISINGTRLVMGSYISLYFRKGTIWGSSGTNIYGAKYSVQAPDSLKFFDGMVTTMGGPVNITHQEEAYLKYFNGTASYRFNGNHLEITNSADAKPLVFERLPEYPANPADLVGTKWQLVSLNNEPVIQGLSITLNFDSDTQASGTAGNFTYELPYETRLYQPSGDDIRWGITSRRTGELPQAMEKQAGDYTSSISWAANYHLTAGRLEIFTARGDTLVYKPSEPVTDYSTLLSNLGTSNVPVTEGEELSQPFLSGKGRIINVNGSSIQVFEYDTPTAMEAESKHVSSDGTDIRGYSVDWIGPPHFYKAGRIIVIYIGKDETITALLEKTLGKQFAGS